MTYGNVGEFRESVESWTQNAERLDQYFEVNEIKDRKKQKVILLSVCGSKTYGMIRDLLQPKRPSESDIKEVYTALERHFSPTPSVIVERFKFHKRSHGEEKNVAEFVAGPAGYQSIASLKQRSKTCCKIDCYAESVMTISNEDC